MPTDDIDHALLKWYGLMDGALGLSHIPLRRLAKHVALLSDILIGKRSCRRYMEQDDMLEAYGAFFFPQTFIRTCFVLSEILSLTDFSETLDHVRILDLGTGMGGSLFAACDVVGGSGMPFHARGVEWVDGAAGAARRIARRASLEDKIDIVVEDFNIPSDGTYDLIVACTSLAEAGPELPRLIENLAAALSCPGCLVVIEPSWRKGYELIRHVGSALHLPPAIPCLNAGSCSFESSESWCFASLDYRLPELACRVNQIVRHNLHFIKLTYGVFCKGVSLRRKGVRAIAPLKRAKGKKLLRLCENGKAFWLERLDRDRSEANMEFDEICCCDIVTFDSRKISEDTRRLEKSHRLTRLV